MRQRTTPVTGSPEFLERMPSDEPCPLPYSAYPRARDVSQHGLQPLPESLPLVDFERAAPYRSSQYSTVAATELTPAQMLQMPWVVCACTSLRSRRSRPFARAPSRSRT